MSESNTEVHFSKNSAPASGLEVHPSSLSILLASGTPLILDGALATYLETLGADISGDLWSASLLLSQPELIYRTHLDCTFSLEMQLLNLNESRRVQLQRCQYTQLHKSMRFPIHTPASFVFDIPLINTSLPQAAHSAIPLPMALSIEL